MTDFTAPEIIAIFAGFGVLVTAIGAAIVSIIVTLRTSAKVDVGTAISAANSQALSEVKSKADLIEGHVNSAATAAAAKIEALQSEVVALTKVLSENKAIAALLAQSAASAPAAPPKEVIVVNAPTDPVPTVSHKPPQKP